MSNVIRLSKRELELLEKYRKINIESCEILAKDFPNQEAEVQRFKEADIAELLESALYTAVFFQGKNLEGMKGN